jgi:hypothetical protein
VTATPTRLANESVKTSASPRNARPDPRSPSLVATRAAHPYCPATRTRSFDRGPTQPVGRSEPHRRPVRFPGRKRPPTASAGSEEARPRSRCACADGVRRAANRRRSARACRRQRRRKPPACRGRGRERACRYHRKDEPQPCGRQGVWKLRLLVGLPRARDVRVEAHVRVCRPQRRIGANIGPHTVLVG